VIHGKKGLGIASQNSSLKINGKGILINRA
jgi:hypothetical protein